MRPEIAVARQWVAKALNDLLDADNNLASARVPTDTVCFHCQQAAEKLLKAALAAQGVPPPRTHVLLMLSDLVVEKAPGVKALDDALTILTPYAVSARYPDDGEAGMPSLEDAREARRCAGEVLDWVRREFPDLME